MDSAEKKAREVLAARPGKLPVQGLYAGSLPLPYALQGMLSDTALPFVEIDSASSEWLSKIVNVKGPDVRLPTYPFLRLSLADETDVDCVVWKTSSDWSKSPPVRPGACLKVQYAATSLADVHLTVDVGDLQRRQLRWVFVDAETRKQLLAVPFWQRQPDGGRLSLSAFYRNRDESSPFSLAIRALVPTSPPRNAEGLPFVMEWLDAVPRELGTPENTKNRIARIRPAERVWPTEIRNESWKAGYLRAQTSQQPVLINNTLLVLPAQHKIRARWYESFERHSIAGQSLLTATYLSAWPQRPDAMSVTVDRTDFAGKRQWRLILTPDFASPAHERCITSSGYCYFYPRAMQIEGAELIVLGAYNNSNDLYEWVVPLTPEEIASPGSI